MLLVSPLHARASRPGEYEVKAVYLLNFGRFLTWPLQITNSSNDTFSICVLGEDPFGRKLDQTLAGETIEGRPVVSRRLQRPEDALGCRIVFVSSSEAVHLGSILEVLGKSPVLTVSDLPDFVARGGMIQFVLQNDRVRFSVNLAAANDAGLVLSSQLLKVASSVETKARSRGTR